MSAACLTSQCLLLLPNVPTALDIDRTDVRGGDWTMNKELLAALGRGREREGVHRKEVEKEKTNSSWRAKEANASARRMLQMF
eukprot:749597-Hanusia_phi.AAC.10